MRSHLVRHFSDEETNLGRGNADFHFPFASNDSRAARQQSA